MCHPAATASRYRTPTHRSSGDDGVDAVHCGLHGHCNQYVNHVVKGGTAFIVELTGDEEVTPEMVARHAAATLEVITL